THGGGVAIQGLAAVAAGAALAWVLNRGLFRPFRKLGASALILLILTIAASQAIQAILQLIFGATQVNYPTGAGAAHKVGPFLWTTVDLATIGIAAAILIGLHLMIRRTWFGRAQRAVADDILLARATGIKAERVIDLTWLLDGAIAGLAGMLLVLQVGSFDPTLGFTFLLVIFAAAVVGGIGQMYGAMLGALIIGVVMEVGAIWVQPDYKQSVAFIALILVLFLRPQGIVPARGELST
ncbi:MAG: branched-chain amino acid ABC transporter permease, partial [Nocardiopsaceae bacterium]|nr:branched-chain amino acid ABC transporter permease [Nocardiopsaceae bacterium]